MQTINISGICTSDKIFVNVCVGMPGSAHDARVLTNSSLNKAVIENGEETLFYNEYHLGDSAYPLKNWLITPFKDYGDLTRRKKNFNYCLSKTRCCIENAFGLLKGRWRRLLYIDVNAIQFASDIVMACCILHNFCLLNSDNPIDAFYDSQEEPLNICNEREHNAASASLKRQRIVDILYEFIVV